MNSKVKQFDWSFKPLTLFLKFLGIPLNFSSNSNRKTTICVSLLGCFIILANLVLNGPRGLEIKRFQWMQEISKFESPFLYFKAHPYGVIKLVKIMSDMIFFSYVPTIHIIFSMSAVLWSRNWTELILMLSTIQQKLKLSKEFYRKCHRQCIFAMFLLTLVQIIIFKTFHFNIYKQILSGWTHSWMELF